VSVVVPAFNEEAGLAESLACIRQAMGAFERRGWTTELIVCDNNSTDSTAAIARAAGAIVVFEPINQISRARNAGAARASGAWLVFVDADTHPTPELFDDVADAIGSGSLLAAGSTVRVDHPGWAVRAAVGFWNRLSRAARWAAGAFIVCDRAVFNAVGGFSLELYAGEEVDLFRRLKRTARRSGRRIRILHRHPLWTSDRKVRLYSWREMLRFNITTVLRLGRTLKSAHGAYPWYDGRREPRQDR
jgi:glycosyltransferase involved in cell wall biosynthesis